MASKSTSHSINSRLAFAQYVHDNWSAIEDYLESKRKNVIIPFYNSVDIRENASKLAPVDNNIYPAGFNNLCDQDLKLATTYFQESIKKLKSEAQIIGLIPESHTKNAFYLDHLHVLKTTLENASFQVKIISFDKELMTENQLSFTSHSGHTLTYHLAHWTEGKIGYKDESANDKMQWVDIAILNHDQSRPIDVPWSQTIPPVVPCPYLGWTWRQKTQHFLHYRNEVEEFCHQFKEINPQLLQAEFRVFDHIDFSSKEGIEELANKVDAFKNELNNPDTRIFIKANQGTYGMGISVVASGEDVRNMNRKDRNKMDVGKNSLKFTSVILQEAIATDLIHEGTPAEVTIYLVNGHSTGGFVRSNPLRGVEDNLNARGMLLTPLSMNNLCANDCPEQQQKAKMYSVIARLSSLAAGKELTEARSKKS